MTIWWSTLFKMLLAWQLRHVLFDTQINGLECLLSNRVNDMPTLTGSMVEQPNSKSTLWHVTKALNCIEAEFQLSPRIVSILRWTDIAK